MSEPLELPQPDPIRIKVWKEGRMWHAQVLSGYMIRGPGGYDHMAFTERAVIRRACKTALDWERERLQAGSYEIPISDIPH